MTGQGACARRLAHFVVRRRRWVVGGAIVFVIVAGALGAGVSGKLSTGGFENPGSESARAADELVQRFPSANEPDFVLLVRPRSGSVDADALRRAGVELIRRLARQPEVIDAASYWTENEPIKILDRAFEAEH